MCKIKKFLPLLLLFCFLITGCGGGNSKDELVSELMYGANPKMNMDSVTKFIQNKGMKPSQVLNKAVLIDEDITDYLDLYSVRSSPTYVCNEDGEITNFYVEVYTSSEYRLSEVRFKIESEFGTPTNIDSEPTEENELYSLTWEDENCDIVMNTYYFNSYYFTLQIDFK